jgi:D-inositol-3-phosphate glycosyltransferase
MKTMMAFCLSPVLNAKPQVRHVKRSSDHIEVAVLTGGFDKPYVFGLTTELASRGMHLEVIGSDEVDFPEMHTTTGLTFLNFLSGGPKDRNVVGKMWRILIYYAQLLRYAATAKPRIFHILWNNKFQLFDRTLLILYYKVLGKKIVFTAHNVNSGKRDSNDSVLNRLTLRIQYRLVDHIFVHTAKMKCELTEVFGVRDEAVTVIPFGINNSVPDTDLTPSQAKRQLSIGEDERVILFFGNIGPYKGLEFLVDAFQQIVRKNRAYRLIIAGKLRGGSQEYWKKIHETIRQDAHCDRVTLKIEYIPDVETELYFKAADVLVLPYTEVSQSGVLFLGYNFGLPAIATDVGSLREDVIDGKTGFLCRPADADDLAEKIVTYFESDVFRMLNLRREELSDYANAKHSWDITGELTSRVYSELLSTGASK